MSADEVRVVVVDDNRDAAESLSLLLELDGYAVRYASDGLEAISIIEEFEPDCVLTDINMPGMNGRELASRLRDLHGRDLVLIAVTGWGVEDDRISAGFEQFDHYLRKPVEVSQLKRLLPPLHTFPASR